MTVPGQAPITYGYDLADRLTSVTQGGTTVTIAYDAAGRRISASLPGGIGAAYAYDPYGMTQVSGQATSNLFAFAGQENDGTGMYNFAGGYYRPDWGQFVSANPAGFDGGSANLYQFAGSNPIGSGFAPGLTGLGGLSTNSSRLFMEPGTF